jgi:AcrR family transcriptional regulator
MQTKVNEEKILEMAFSLFMRQGIKSTSMYDVAHKNGISTKILSQIFATKNSLVLAIVEQILERHSKHLQVNQHLSPNATAEMNNFFQFMENLVCVLPPPLLREIRKYYADAWNKLIDFRENKLIPYIKENIKRGISEDCYRSDFDQDIYARIYFMQVNAMAEIQQLSKMEMQNLLPELHSIFIHGILNIRGLRLMTSK